MIRLKLLSMPYINPDESQQHNPLAVPRWERGWGNDFSKYLEQGQLRNPLCVDLLNKLEGARWSEDDCRIIIKILHLDCRRIGLVQGQKCLERNCEQRQIRFEL